MLGFAGSVVSMITPWDSAAEYARVPLVLNVMSCDSVPRPGRVGQCELADVDRARSAR